MTEKKHLVRDNAKFFNYLKKWQGFNRQGHFWLFVLIAVLSVAIYKYYFLLIDPKSQSNASPLVKLASVQARDVPIYLAALGTVTPLNSVTVRTQINGQLMQIHFREGQLVKIGDLLAEIDSQPYQAQLIEYQGQFERDQAQLDNAKIDLKRYQLLWKQKSISQQVLATQVALVKQLEGTVKIDQGLIRATEISLSYCRIKSPIDGRIGLRFVDPGNFIQTSDTSGLAIINTLNPITVVFSIPQDDISKITRAMMQAKTILVDVYDREKIKHLASGTLLTIDNQIDPTTGTVKLKAQFQNDHNQLFANQFVNVRLQVDTLHHVLTIPTAAIQYTNKAAYVYVFNEKTLVVHEQVIKPDVTIKDMTVITSGLSLGDRIVEQGVDKLTEGVQVSVLGAPHVSASNKQKMAKWSFSLR